MDNKSKVMNQEDDFKSFQTTMNFWKEFERKQVRVQNQKLTGDKVQVHQLCKHEREPIIGPKMSMLKTFHSQATQTDNTSTIEEVRSQEIQIEIGRGRSNNLWDDCLDCWLPFCFDCSVS
ncbi:uncharacterized protein [Halyomorpha halys]|uniref:uncharacterized protein n=1 Tax=Halyomorpha halys TaxID=286706 RepID=UPI0006D4C759|nr:uncharacterized protein LOC106689617 [Halyomorpha halys]